MGGVFCSGVDNNDLVNVLKLLGYIRSKRVEWVFRAVDRGDYVLPAHRVLAYKDLSWKLGYIHLSAPCVYCKVMEGLSLKPGLSFLNIGSGTGYLSTMAGLILGKNGTNHGIEIHEDCIVYAYEHLETFKQNSLDVDTFEFCEPVFQLGNILNVTPNRRYDRVYCGAACPESHEKYIKQFVKVGGILVMPYKDNLLRIQRFDENTWKYHTMLPVSFATLVTPPEGKDSGLLQLPLSQPSSLQELCRSSIRCHLRKLVWSEHNDLECKMLIKAPPKQREQTQTHRVRDNPFLDEADRSPARNGESPTRSNRYRRQAIMTAPMTMSTLCMARRFLYNEVDGDDDAGDEDGDRRVMTASDDSADGDETEPENPARETSNFEAAMQQDFFEAANHAPMEDDDDDCGKAEGRKNTPNEARDAGTEDREGEREDRRASARPSDSKLKRKSDAIGPNNEPHNSRQRYRLDDQSDFCGESSSDQAAAPSASSSNGLSNGATSDRRADTGADDEDEDDDDDVDVDREADWLQQAFSIFDDKYGMEVNNDSTSDTSDSSGDDELPSSPEIEGLPAGASSSSSSSSSSDSSRDENADEAARSDQRSEASDCNNDDDSSNETSSYDCSDASGSDRDIELFFNGVNLRRDTYARAICTERVTRFMRSKVEQLPLPMPLRLYLNYNREL